MTTLVVENHQPAPTPTSEPQEEPSSASVIAGAIKGMVQSIQNLIKHHLELAKEEAKADAIEIGQDVAGLVIAGVFAALGYLFLLCSAVLFAAWFAGIAGMALASFTLALIHLLGGGVIALKMVEHFKTRHYGLVQTRREIEHSKEWVEGPVKQELHLPSLPERKLDEETPAREEAPALRKTPVRALDEQTPAA